MLLLPYFFLLCYVFGNWGPFIKMLPGRFLPLISGQCRTIRSFLASLLSQFQGLVLLFVNLFLTLTGNKKKQIKSKLWSLPSSNIMESVSLGFGKKRHWWQHDRVMPYCSRLLFQLRPPLNTVRGYGEPTIQPVTRKSWETQIVFWNKISKHQPLNTLTPRVTCVTNVASGTPEKYKTIKQPCDYTTSLDHFNKLTLKFTPLCLCKSIYIK